ncbi:MULTISPECIES: class I mannose-6-phosphate isomerase [unclassified Mucilaginibacter]|uniref:class I mannose-6-phosphate isomerase n=1 Tax=unclassified Mucilaginibacter TaxID=2617802 RepID=UPI002AC8D7CC|nr:MULTISPECIES: class I mannose-6-phosphate isomerase [unclassified Mucilaginibacter]MEB0263263.1 class I mannose-6-phosphate isomerase [Mucilaginibacter sp. 10I4]MEB0280838.1 class I mannose-6-phosphate isomerase [Mucilaginibacter sp. 10B2]MEB0302309.1 class I mannose-6-phosphate isomerase [Mucilaginibacter sp. 5C4]WPX21716.1 class I mannose-6-phosphate isomerase [Mucilaginibacter sp. 5C4]
MTYNPNIANDKITKPLNELRSTDQLIMSGSTNNHTTQNYDIYPSFKINGTIYNGYNSLADHIINTGGNFILDGYGGVQWAIVKALLSNALKVKGVDANWISIETYLKPKQKIDRLIAPYLGGDDPLFGKVYPGDISDFYDTTSIDTLKPAANKLNIVYSCGAALVNWDSPVVYFDVPKNEIQFRSRAGNVCNLGAGTPIEPKAQYKRFYFIDWVVLNKHKQALLSRINAFVDEQRPNDITWIKGDALRAALTDMSTKVFRARPWFEPGIWGGQWIKNNIDGLNKDIVNYAWSFELIAPENGVVLENAGRRLEVSIDSVLYNNNRAVLGKAAKRFGCKFPIRFDFLDTMDGDNLSVQCHPTVAYTKANFGEDFTQDETYYILEAEPGAEVYLGFQENIDKDSFKTVLEESFKNSEPINVNKYVQVFPAKKHDLFLIPNGTVHCSGKNNMVLEISATPYIFTFKMYDWVRPDLTSKPRTLNIDRAFDNLNFDRKGDVATETLISKQSVVKKGTDWQLLNLSTHPDHFYNIDRFEFDTRVVDVTNDHCLVLSLVEGDCITVKTGDLEQVIHYAETFIIPANANIYSMYNNGQKRAKVVKAYVKDECC